MTVHALRCSAPDHASRQGQPGYSDLLGSVELPDGVTPGRQLQGYLCGACGEAQRAAQSKKRQVPAGQQLAVLARAVRALATGQNVTAADLTLLGELGGP